MDELTPKKAIDQESLYLLFLLFPKDKTAYLEMLPDGSARIVMANTIFELLRHWGVSLKPYEA